MEKCLLRLMNNSCSSSASSSSFYSFFQAALIKRSSFGEWHQGRWTHVHCTAITMKKDDRATATNRRWPQCHRNLHVVSKMWKATKKETKDKKPTEVKQRIGETEEMRRPKNCGRTKRRLEFSELFNRNANEIECFRSTDNRTNKFSHILQ